MKKKNQRLRVMVVCPFGLGTSMILKMGVDDVLAEEKIDVDTFCSDADTALGQDYDLLLTSITLKKIFDDISQPVIIIENFLNSVEIKSKVLPVVKKLIKSQG